MTEYVVLVNMGGTEIPQWHEHARVQARSAPSAIRESFDGIEAEPESRRKHWVAVPARSFKPVTVKVETKTALRFS